MRQDGIQVQSDHVQDGFEGGRLLRPGEGRLGYVVALVLAVLVRLRERYTGSADGPEADEPQVVARKSCGSQDWAYHKRISQIGFVYRRAIIRWMMATVIKDQGCVAPGPSSICPHRHQSAPASSADVSLQVDPPRHGPASGRVPVVIPSSPGLHGLLSVLVLVVFRRDVGTSTGRKR